MAKPSVGLLHTEDVFIQAQPALAHRHARMAGFLEQMGLPLVREDEWTWLGNAG